MREYCRSDQVPKYLQWAVWAQVGEVLEESARIAMSWIQAHAGALGLPTPKPAAASGDSAKAGGAIETEPSCWDVHGAWTLQ